MHINKMKMFLFFQKQYTQLGNLIHHCLQSQNSGLCNHVEECVVLGKAQASPMLYEVSGTPVGLCSRWSALALHCCANEVDMSFGEGGRGST